MTRSYNTIDADGHVLEPPDMWLNYMESKYHDRAPRIVINEYGKETFQIKPGKSCPCRKAQSGSALPALTARARARKSTLRNIPRRAKGASTRTRGFLTWTPEGIDAAFLYPTLGLFVACIEDDPELSAADCRAYNRWLADYCKVYPDRLFGAAMLPMISVEAAIAGDAFCRLRARDALGLHPP